jgi:hypothetical protein
MKRCTRCKVEKAPDGFPARKKARDGKASWCSDCFKESWRERYYGKHSYFKQRHAESRNRLRGEKARRVYDYLLSHPCVDCGEQDPVVLEFDHRSDSAKFESVTQMVIDNASWENIAAEIRKCEVRCANCHRRRTAAQFGYKRFLFKGAQPPAANVPVKPSRRYQQS